MSRGAGGAVGGARISLRNLCSRALRRVDALQLRVADSVVSEVRAGVIVVGAAGGGGHGTAGADRRGRPTDGGVASGLRDSVARAAHAVRAQNGVEVINVAGGAVTRAAGRGDHTVKHILVAHLGVRLREEQTRMRKSRGQATGEKREE